VKRLCCGLPNWPGATITTTLCPCCGNANYMVRCNDNNNAESLLWNLPSMARCNDDPKLQHRKLIVNPKWFIYTLKKWVNTNTHCNPGIKYFLCDWRTIIFVRLNVRLQMCYWFYPASEIMWRNYFYVFLTNWGRKRDATNSGKLYWENDLRTLRPLLACLFLRGRRVSFPFT
jgi:hypothetical protein